MRTDINKIDKVTEEMRLNDIVFSEMMDELDREIESISEHTPGSLPCRFESLYFKRRIISVLANHDLPFKCAIGLYFMDNKLELLDAFHEEYIADEDTESEIFKYILEFGYQLYDGIACVGETVEEVYENVKHYREFVKEGEIEDDE